MLNSLALALLALVYPQPKRKRTPLRGGRYYPESRGYVRQYRSYNKGPSTLFIVLMIPMICVLIVLIQQISGYIPEGPIRPTDLQYKVNVLEDWASADRFSNRQYRMMGKLFDWELPIYLREDGI